MRDIESYIVAAVHVEMEWDSTVMDGRERSILIPSLIPRHFLKEPGSEANSSIVPKAAYGTIA